MGFTLRMAAAATALLAVTATTSSATKPHARGGFTVGFGLGAGNAAWDWAAPGTDSPSEWSGAGNFRIGGAIREDLVLAFESSVWIKNYDLVSEGLTIGDARVTFNTATFAATWFPGNRGAFLRGGVGFASARGEVNSDELAFIGLDSTDNGVAALSACGYEWRLSDKFAIGPQVEVVFLGTSGDVVDNVVIFDGSVQFNWYW
jgi:hypothetical protein